MTWLPRPWVAGLHRLPISVRLGTAFAALFFLALCGAGAVAHWGLGQWLRLEVDRSLVAAVQTLREAGAASDVEDEELGGVESPEFETQVIAADGRVVAGSDDDVRVSPLLSPDQQRTADEAGYLFADVAVDDEAQRALAVPIGGERPSTLVVITDLEAVREAQLALLLLTLALSPVAALVAGGAGWFVAHRGLLPIAHMTRDAAAIGAHGPFPRLAVPATHDEVAHLGHTLNGLLARIEEARRRERDFTADASHELRTPLAILRAELERARAHADSSRLVTALDSALEESDRLGALIDDLLLLARADAGQLRAQGLLDVSDVTDGLLPGFRVLAGRRGITLLHEGDATVRADGRALARAVGNLLDNAIRHAPDGGHVALRVAQAAGSTSITVSDDGSGVPPEERARMAERFAQLDRTRTAGGAGLGLAIVASVAEAHGGWVEFAEGPDGRGLSVSLHLPGNGARTTSPGSARGGATS